MVMKFFYSALDDYWLWREINFKLNISNPSYKYWKNCKSFKLGKRYIFIKKLTLPQKYTWIESSLTKLGGYLPTQYASNMLNTDNHIFNYKRMSLHGAFEYKFVNDVKFVNIKRFFLENNIRIKSNSYMQLAPTNKLHITPDSTFYKINNYYGLVIYD